jgi:hypothetical protein
VAEDRNEAFERMVAATDQALALKSCPWIKLVDGMPVPNEDGEEDDG